MHNFLRFFTLLTALSLVGCGATLPKVKPYKMDIQQGNVVTSEMLLKLRPGMTKSQVKFIMGTPLLVDSFRTNRWDYFYQLRKQGKIVNQKRVILDFEDDLLKRVRGDVVPQGKTVQDVTKELEEEAKGKEKGSPEVSEPIDNPLEETPATEAVDQASEEVAGSSGESLEEEPASVLVVPMESAVASDSAASAVTEAAEEGAQQAAATAEEVKEEVPIAVERSEVSEADVIKPKAEAIEPKIKMPEGEPVAPIAEMEPTVETAKETSTVMPSKADDKLIFRMDKTLDTTRIIPQEVSASDAPLDSVVQEAKSTEDSLPAEEPSFFERMLEKIGF